MTPPLRRTRRDLAITAALALLAVVAVVAVLLTADVRHTQRYDAAAEGAEVAQAAETPAVAPATLTPAYTVATADTPMSLPKPQTAAGLTFVVAEDGTTLKALSPTGETAWSYSRNLEICFATVFQNDVVVAFRKADLGCGDVVGLKAATGAHARTRSAYAAGTGAALLSNDRVGLVSPERAELWRSDLVRTVEYGDVPFKQESNQQPHEECTITSALTRGDLLAVTEECPATAEGGGGTWLRLMDSAPDDSREPEVQRDEHLTPGSVLVAVGDHHAAVYQRDGAAGRIVSYSTSGERLADSPAPTSPLLSSWDTQRVFAPVTADLPHNMSWFDGAVLHLLRPSTLQELQSFPDARGTGVAVGGRLLYPTAAGVAVANWETGEVERVIPVDRGGYDGQVTLAVTGNQLIERRGDVVAALTMG